MEDGNEVIQRNKKKSGIIKYLIGKVVTIALIGLVIAVIIIGFDKYISHENKTTKIGFDDIGELATQSAYCTEVNVTDASREVFGVEIPFTQSKYIYSYDIIIKAGLDFKEIEWDVKGTTIEVKLPKTRVLSNEIDPDSFKLYHEDESIFREITLSENNDAMKKMKENAEKNAIANGLLNEARSNAETILTGYFAKEFDLQQYKIEFEEK